MTISRAANVLSSVVIALVVVLAVLVLDGPAWAAVAFGLVTYLHQVNLPLRRTL